MVCHRPAVINNKHALIIYLVVFLLVPASSELLFEGQQVNGLLNGFRAGPRVPLEVGFTSLSSQHPCGPWGGARMPKEVPATRTYHPSIAVPWAGRAYAHQ